MPKAKYVRAILWKMLLNGLPVAAVLAAATGLGLGVIAAYVAVLTVLAYLVGDFVILPAWGSTAATLADGAMAFVTVFALRPYGYVDSLHALLVAAAVMLVEGLCFHAYLFRHVLQDR